MHLAAVVFGADETVVALTEELPELEMLLLASLWEIDGILLDCWMEEQLKENKLLVECQGEIDTF
jgi:hypothetical protein